MNKELEQYNSAIKQIGRKVEEVTEAFRKLTQALTEINFLNEINSLQENEEVYNPIVPYKEEIVLKSNYDDKIQKEKINGNLNLSLYELNKSAVSQLRDYTEEDFTNAINVINNFVGTNKFYMLLCKEANYYTVFMREPYMTETIGEAVIDCLRNFSSSIKSIEVEQNNASIEIWAKYEDTILVMYFFPYDEGVIICR